VENFYHQNLLDGTLNMNGNAKKVIFGKQMGQLLNLELGVEFVLVLHLLAYKKYKS